jgi:4-hydroxy-tetrahydrodipicolinate synthase
MTTGVLAPGVWGVVATPYDESLAVDLPSLRRLVAYYEFIGVTGLTVLGVFGEAASLSRAERLEVLGAVVDEVHLPLVVGLTSLATAPAIEEVLATQEVVGDRLAAAMVQINSPVASVVTAHLQAIVDHTGVPVVIQDYPVASGVTITGPALKQVAESVTAVAAIKAEAPPTPPAIAALAGVGVPVFGGLGGLGLIDELACGSAGAMTGFSYPEALIACVKAYAAGGYDLALKVFAPYLPLVNFEQQARIALAIRKECLKVRGLIDNAAVRPPAVSLPDALREQLVRHMAYADSLS